MSTKCTHPYMIVCSPPTSKGDCFITQEKSLGILLKRCISSDKHPAWQYGEFHNPVAGYYKTPLGIFSLNFLVDERCIYASFIHQNFDQVWKLIN